MRFIRVHHFFRWIVRLDEGVTINYDAEETRDHVMERSTDYEIIKPESDFYTFTAIQNVCVWKSEFAPSVREGMKHWNMTVRYWLLNQVYRRFPGPKLIR